MDIIINIPEIILSICKNLNEKDILNFGLVSKSHYESMQFVFSYISKYKQTIKNVKTKNEYFAINKWILDMFPLIDSYYGQMIHHCCPICRKKLIENCYRHNSINCPIIVGKCKHVYHDCCMSRWLNQRLVCPLDNHEFKQENWKILY